MLSSTGSTVKVNLTKCGVCMSMTPTVLRQYCYDLVYVGGFTTMTLAGIFCKLPCLPTGNLSLECQNYSKHTDVGVVGLVARVLS